MGGHDSGATAFSTGVTRALRLLVCTATSVLLLTSCARGAQTSVPSGLMGGPLGRFLASSSDLGPARDHAVQLTVALRGSARPQALIGWADSHRLSVRWRPGDNYAYVQGGPDDLGRAFGVAVHDYRSADRQVFYAARQQPVVPGPVRGDVTGLGRILSYHPNHVIKPPMLPLDVPNGMLTPTQLRTTYDATPLATTGKGQTVVFFEVDRFEQGDLDKFSDFYQLPRFTPTVKGSMPEIDEGETPMDLQVVHAIAPDAQQVIYYTPINGDYRNLAGFLEQADSEYPGAIWSLSFGIGCDTIDQPADLLPVRDAFAAAARHGTSIFISSGDTGGYECKGYGKFDRPDASTPPIDGEIGLSSLASVPEATDTGGTTLSTDEHGVWANEQGWADYPATQGTGGGVSTLFPRPDWQSGVSLPPDPVFAQRSIPDPTSQRLTPDISADADPLTGAATFYHCRPGNCDANPGGGTSQAAPIWAALTTLMNQYLTEQGGHQIGNPGKPMNPLLYQVAASGARPAFHDVTLGGNAVYQSGPGFDLATGLGTPDTNNLANDILDIQKAGG
jgi:kumamolisin